MDHIYFLLVFLCSQPSFDLFLAALFSLWLVSIETPICGVWLVSFCTSPFTQKSNKSVRFLPLFPIDIHKTSLFLFFFLNLYKILNACFLLTLKFGRGLGISWENASVEFTSRKLSCRLLVILIYLLMLILIWINFKNNYRYLVHFNLTESNPHIYFGYISMECMGIGTINWK